MSTLTLMIVLLVGGVIVAIFALLMTPSANQRRESSQRSAPLPAPLPVPTPAPMLLTDQSFSDTSLPEANENSQTEESETEDDPLDALRLKERIRSAESSGQSTQEVLTALIDELDNENEVGEIVQALAELRYTPQDLAPCLTANRYGLSTLVELFREHCEADTETVIAALFPVVAGETVYDRARQVLKAIQESEGVTWNDGDYGNTEPVDCIEPLMAQGCAAGGVLSLLVETSDRCLGALVEAFSPAQRPDLEAVARVVREQHRDLTSDEERDALREEAGYEAKDVLRLCFLAGIPVTDAADLVGMFDDDELDEALTAFLGAGYGFRETLVALNAQDAYTTAALVEAALDAHASREELVSFLVAEQVDPEELDNDLSEETEIPFRQRVDLIHALVHAYQWDD